MPVIHLVANKGRGQHPACMTIDSYGCKRPMSETVGGVTCKKCLAFLRRMYSCAIAEKPNVQRR